MTTPEAQQSSAEIVCDESDDALTYFITAIVFGCFGIPMFHYFKFGDPSNDFFIWGARLVFPIIATGQLILAARSYIRRKKFGVSTFRIKDTFGAIGGMLSGIISNTVEIRPKADYKITLECVKVTVDRGPMERLERRIRPFGRERLQRAIRR